MSKIALVLLAYVCWLPALPAQGFASSEVRQAVVALVSALVSQGETACVGPSSVIAYSYSNQHASKKTQ